MKKKKAKSFTVLEIAKKCGLTETEIQKTIQASKLPCLDDQSYSEEIVEKFFSNPGEKAIFQAKILAISNQKGGEGKTTISIFLAEALSYSSKTLLIDWDPQANATRMLSSEPQHSIFESLSYRGNVPVPVHTIIKKIQTNLDLLPSSISLANLTTPFGIEDFELLKDALKPLKTEYEYIIIDCPPSLGLGLENALIAADYVLIPIQARAFSVQGLQDLHKTIEKIKTRANSKLRLLGAVLNQYEESRALSGLSNGIKKYFPVFETIIHRRESIPQAQAKRKMLSACDPNSKNAFKNLAREVKLKTNV